MDLVVTTRSTRRHATQVYPIIGHYPWHVRPALPDMRNLPTFHGMPWNTTSAFFLIDMTSIRILLPQGLTLHVQFAPHGLNLHLVTSSRATSHSTQRPQGLTLRIPTSLDFSVPRKPLTSRTCPSRVNRVDSTLFHHRIDPHDPPYYLRTLLTSFLPLGTPQFSLLPRHFMRLSPLWTLPTPSPPVPALFLPLALCNQLQVYPRLQDYPLPLSTHLLLPA